MVGVDAAGRAGKSRRSEFHPGTDHLTRPHVVEILSRLMGILLPQEMREIYLAADRASC
jgi:hypothetical protein